MRRTETLKNILLYLLLPEDTTEAGCYGNSLDINPALSERQTWLGPLKTVFWLMMAVAGPMLLFTLLA
ncbi:MAG: hypothetical protein ACD_75C00519G0006 [uncultured bacterium]|nr:MAG: hypothetical protein ACD_75C00519G0006 [uncultured bacterium]